jgi:hypothetical protein
VQNNDGQQQSKSIVDKLLVLDESLADESKNVVPQNETIL